MTRFARAKGSKSSNEKKPEEATSWTEIKSSMMSQKLNKSEAVPPKEEIKIDPPKQTEWSSLSNFDNSVSLLKQHFGKKISQSKSAVNFATEKIKNSVHKERISTINSEVYESKEKKNKKRKFESDVDLEKALSKKKKKLSKSEQLNSEVQVKKQKNGNVSDKNSKCLHDIKKTKKSECFKKEFNKNCNSKKNNKNFFSKVNKQPKEKKKFKNKSFTEKKSSIEELIINGEKIQIVKFQGFNVTLEDAERLKKLRNEMLKEGIPKEKLKAAIKLERRRAEKALSRLKKSVCFHCRGHGHLLSNCPNLTEKENTSTGICYKCGSSEHSATECKVVRGTNYQFAECFICNEQGHIARQCPDNPRGLYPQGGACRECGDVTHLRKDCPQVQTQKEEEMVTVRVRNDRDLECLDEEIGSKEKQNPKKKEKKNLTVKF